MVLRHASSAIGRETRARKEGEAPCCLRRTGSSSPQLKEALGRHRQTKSHVALAWTARSELQLPPPSFATMSTRSKLCGRGMKRARRRGEGVALRIGASLTNPFAFRPLFFFFFLAADAFFLPTADATRRLVATPSRLPPSPSLFQTLAYVCALGQRKVGVAPHATAVRGVEFVRRNLWERLPPALLCHCLLMPKKKKNSSADGLDFSRMQKKRARARSLSPRLSCAGEVGGL